MAQAARMAGNERAAGRGNRRGAGVAGAKQLQGTPGDANNRVQPRNSQVAPGKQRPDAALSTYLGRMAEHRLMTPAEEVAAAAEVKQLEIAYWEALLSYPQTLETVASVISRNVEEPLPELPALRRLRRSAKRGKFTRAQQDRWDRTASKLSAKLRELDGDRKFVREADAAVHRLAGARAAQRDVEGKQIRITERFHRYLGHVVAARDAQSRAKNRFVSANLRLVVAVARRYNRGMMPLIDLIQEGNLGLMKAVERFDHTRGYRFSTYASWWIRHAISRALADKSRVVRVPVHMLDVRNRVAKAKQRLSLRSGETPTARQVAEEVGISVKKLDKVEGDYAATPFSLDRPLNDEDGRTFVDMLADDERPSPYDDVVSTKWQHEVTRLLSTLSPIESRILRWRFGLDGEEEQTLKSIGDHYNLSRERIRQLEQQALRKMRRQMRE